MTIVGGSSQGTISKESPVSTLPKEEKKENVFDTMDKDSNVEVSKEIAENARLPGNTSGSNKRTVINYEDYDKDELTLTLTEKSKFIDAMITGDRYKQEFSIFGGRVRVTIHSRTTEETQAMYAYIRHEISKKDGNMSALESDMQYLLLVAQVEEVNGTKYPEMKTPLTYVESDGKQEAPGWMTDLAVWKRKPEGLTSAIINRIQLFEYKYWTMVKEASNKNFWNSDTSIAG